jgi:hypothetical protein
MKEVMTDMAIEIDPPASQIEKLTSERNIGYWALFNCPHRWIGESKNIPRKRISGNAHNDLKLFNIIHRESDIKRENYQKSNCLTKRVRRRLTVALQ